MDSNVFMDKSKKPGDSDLKEVLGDKYVLWQQIHDYILQQYPAAIEEWNFSGAKYGWSFRMKDKKRAIAYFLARDNKSFKVALVYGEKATQQALNSSVSDLIKNEIREARVYAEGRGFRLDIPDKNIIPDIKTLIDIKISN
jgi:hypothetical protein